MSLYDYMQSKKISRNDPGFTALLFSLIRKADTLNLALIESVFPAHVEEMKARYNAPGGCLNEDEVEWYNGYLAATTKEDDDGS